MAAITSRTRSWMPLAAILVALLAACAMIGAEAAPYPDMIKNPLLCPKAVGKSSWHLSCYAATIKAPNAIAAKNDCFKAWRKPRGCVAKMFAAARGFGCPLAVRYYFNTQACLDSYQAQEKTNKGCDLYIKFGLGLDKNRANPTNPKTLKDWNCGIKA